MIATRRLIISVIIDGYRTFFLILRHIIGIGGFRSGGLRLSKIHYHFIDKSLQHLPPEAPNAESFPLEPICL